VSSVSPERCEITEVYPFLRARSIASRAVSYTHLDVYKRQGWKCKRVNAREGNAGV